MQENLSKPLGSEDVDASSGILIPYYDFDTKVVFLAGKVFTLSLCTCVKFVGFKNYAVALNSLICVHVPSRNYSLTHAITTTATPQIRQQ